MYIFVQKLTNRTEYVTINIEKITAFMKKLLIRLIFGISIGILDQSKKLTKQILNIFNINTENTIELLFFNLLMNELTIINTLEKYRIYKTDKNKFNFNPTQIEIAQFITRHFPRIKVVFPKSNIEKKITDIIIEGTKQAKEETVKGTLKLKDSKSEHQGLVHVIGQNESGMNMVGMNTTSQPQTMGFKNIAITDKSFMTPTLFLEKEHVIIKPPKIIVDLNDSRLKASLIDLDIIGLLTSIGFETPKHLTYIKSLNKFQIIESKPATLIRSLNKYVRQYDCQPNDSFLYD